MESTATLRSTPSIGLLIFGGLAFGSSYGFLEETQAFGVAAWWVFMSVAVFGAALGVAYSNRNSDGVRYALKALPVLVAALVGLALGDFAAYALGIDGRNLDNYSVSLAWQTNLLVTLALATLFGSLLGILAALLSHMLRRSIDRNAV